MSSYIMANKSMNIHNIDIKKINKMFEGIDFNDNKKVNNSVDLNLCQSCGSDKIVEDLTQCIMICTCCGQTLESNVVDTNPEWKQFDDDGGGALGGRCSAVNPLLPQSSLGTSIQGYGKSKLKTLHSWNAMPYRERTLNNEFKKIHDICVKDDIPKCVEDDTKILYKMANDCKHQGGDNDGKYIITRGINRVSISSGCMSLACLKNGHTRTSKEIASSYGIKESETNEGFKTVIKMLKLKNLNLIMGTSKAQHFVKRYCERLKIKNCHIDEVVKVTQNIEKINIASDHTPYSVAATSILLVAERFEIRSVTKKKIAYEFGLSDVTIAKTYKELEPFKHVLFDNNAVNDIVKQMNVFAVEEETSPEVLARMKKFDMIEDKHTKQIKQIEKITNLEKNDLQIPIPVQKSDTTEEFHREQKDNLTNENFKNIQKLQNYFDITLAQKILENIKNTNCDINKRNIFNI